MIKNCSVLYKGIIHSGGSKGTEQFFGDIGSLLGYKVIHHSFAGHQPYGDGTIAKHPLAELEEAAKAIIKANRSLKRQIPPYEYDLNLVRRNFFQVVNSDFIVAIAPFEQENIVAGSTGWAVQMAKDIKKTIYVFDDSQSKQWYISQNGKSFKPHSGKIPNLGIFAGIGTRNISDTGKNEIKKILMYNTKDLEDKLKYVFSMVNDDLKFSEAKNLFLATFSGALVGILSGLLRIYYQEIINKALLVPIFTMISFFFIACVISILSAVPSPLNDSNKENRLHWYGISYNHKTDSASYLSYVKNNYLGPNEQMNCDLSQRILTISLIANKKFKYFKLAVYSILLGIIIGTGTMLVLSTFLLNK